MKMTRKKIDAYKIALTSRVNWSFAPGYYAITDEGNIVKRGEAGYDEGFHLAFTGNRETDIANSLEYLNEFNPAE